ncbi:MAG: glutamate--tRNA ligase [Christensenellaceae bacterium]|nr:glutamate--tRNA ligase [Christensenellaceae bacterium]
MEVRTRFAPSPTGYLHIGGLRTALYAWLFARKNKGSFILRIEDTDRERLVDDACRVIYDTMREAGLYYDEGPDVGGDYGPYIQSERKDLYKKYAEELVEKGAAYYCFCTKERLEQLHDAVKDGNVAKYDKHCLKLSPEEIKEKLDAGVPYVIRQNIPETGETTYEDAVFGTITVPNCDMDDNVLLKSDGYPTYNLANVVDDHLMGITHVIRGVEYLSSTPKYNLLYDALGWQKPEYIHLPPVMKDKHQKLSKRNGDASYEDFIKKGYIKDAIINYIALLGWSPAGTQEIFSLEELTEAFSLEGLSKSPAIFDNEKLTWMNAEYLRNMSLEQFEELARPYMAQAIDTDRFDTMLISRLIQPRTEVLTEIPGKIAFLQKMPEYSSDLYFHKKMKTSAETAPPMLKAAREALSGLDDFTEEGVHDLLIGLAEKLEVKNGQLMWPVRVALSGEPVTPGGAVEIAVLLGKEETLKRLDDAIAALE